ncbi:Protoporphyrinogen oxidase [Posidoniimonas polymericola]|uniref:Coproporphyrinogen III oxidase n=1 Tax=Posidoniimonas polymericola TaxID=2528002 RepID=A0A5C5YPP3_9BACT|nr:protoporphyrinogen oxidase [Posidoniimonas polymericola]TWT76876.1 Protoporphyrinogen oxidase [Posidoniimonas polymericola]
MSENHAPRRIAIIGGGVAGLAAAVRLTELSPRVEPVVFEAEPQAGGVIHTVHDGEWMIEKSADNFLTKAPHGTRFCEKLGLTPELLETDPARRRALVVSNGRVTPTPEGFLLMSARAILPILRTPVLSWRGKLRLLSEPFVPRRKDDSDESVADFARRRVGREAFERLVQPLLAGIYTADPERLSMRATMPQFVENEQQHGSLFLAARRQKKQERQQTPESGARYSQFVAPRGGMQAIIDAAVAKLPEGAVRLLSPVRSVSQVDAQWRLEFEGREPEEFDGLIVATPAYHAARLLADADERLASLLEQIEYAGSTIVCLGVRVDQLPELPTGFGFVVPAVERRKIIAASFSSLKFPNRTPHDRLLIRVFFGGALQPELAELPDDQLIELAKQELGELCGLTGEPEQVLVARWPRRMPQYHLGHNELVDQIELQAASHRGLALAGAAYRGVGVPQCIDSGESAAERLHAQLASTPSG